MPLNLKFPIYTTISLKFFLPHLKTNLQKQIVGEKTKFNPQTINRGNFFSNVINLNLQTKKKIFKLNRPDLGNSIKIFFRLFLNNYYNF